MKYEVKRAASLHQGIQKDMACHVPTRELAVSRRLGESVTQRNLDLKEILCYEINRTNHAIKVGTGGQPAP
jgi:hypothetical protein